MLRTILHTVSELKSDMLLCNNRMSELENTFANANMPHLDSDMQSTLERDEDTLSITAGNDASSVYDDLTSQSPTPAVKPPEQATKPPEQAIKPPNVSIPVSSGIPVPHEPCHDMDNDGAIAPSKQQYQASELGEVSGSERQSGLYNPDAVQTSWSPSQAFHDFLEKNFRRKLSFEHICEILEEQSVPNVDVLVAPTLDPPVLSHVSSQNKKFVQERDKELAVVQWALLNITGPLCTLHDRLEHRVPVSPDDLKLIVQQSLCLLGSANTQLSVLWRKKVLASINKSKIDLATQPLPNAKRWLFGDDFPSIASKEA